MGLPIGQAVQWPHHSAWQRCAGQLLPMQRGGWGGWNTCSGHGWNITCRAGEASGPSWQAFGRRVNRSIESVLESYRAVAQVFIALFAIKSEAIRRKDLKPPPPGSPPGIA